MSRWDTLAVGIDPGLHTGVAVRLADDLLAWKVIDVMASERDTVTQDNITSLLRQIEVVLSQAVANATTGHRRVIVAVEHVVEPTGFDRGRRAPINFRSLITTCAVWGAVLAHPWPDRAQVLNVRPAGNGSGLLASYPPPLITPAERRKGLMREAGQSAKVRHARSAWDVAGIALLGL